MMKGLSSAKTGLEAELKSHGNVPHPKWIKCVEELHIIKYIYEKKLKVQIKLIHAKRKHVFVYLCNVHPSLFQHTL